MEAVAARCGPKRQPAKTCETQPQRSTEMSPWVGFRDFRAGRTGLKDSRFQYELKQLRCMGLRGAGEGAGVGEGSGGRQAEAAGCSPAAAAAGPR